MASTKYPERYRAFLQANNNPITLIVSLLESARGPAVTSAIEGHRFELLAMITWPKEYLINDDYMHGVSSAGEENSQGCEVDSVFFPSPRREFCRSEALVNVLVGFDSLVRSTDITAI